MDNQFYDLRFYQGDKLSILNLKDYKIKLYSRSDEGFDGSYYLEIINDSDISMNSIFLNFIDFEEKVNKIELFDNLNGKILYDMTIDDHLNVNLANNSSYKMHQLIFVKIKEIK